jgi:hypothetical protein
MKLLFIMLGLLLVSLSVFAFSYWNNEVQPSDDCGLIAAKEMMNLTLPLQEKYCKQLGGQPLVIVMREESDLNVPIVVPICLRESFVEPVEGVN